MKRLTAWSGLVAMAGLALVACQQLAPVAASGADSSAAVEAAPATRIAADLESEATPWTSLEAADAPEDFHFVVVTDRTGGARPGVFESAMPKVNLLSPAFVVSVGDLIEGYTEDQARIDQEWDEMEGFISELHAPFFYTAGNHDMNNAVMARTWQRRFGPSFYHFEYKDVLFVVLNSELFGMVGQPDVSLPGPWTQAQQMAFVEQVLADNTDARWTVVLVHQPLWDAEAINPDWLQVEALLGERPYTVFAGHFHQYSKRRRHDRNYITLATTGGVSGLRGPVFGEFDHVAWVTMTAEGPRIANVELDGIHDEDVSSPALQAQAETLAGSVALAAQPGRGATFRKTQMTLTIRNDGAEQLDATPVLSRLGNFTVAGLKPLSVAPGATAALPITVSTPQPQPYRTLVPAAIDWTLTTRLDERPVQVVSTTPVLPVTTHQIERATAAPVIDGDLSEWGTLRYQAREQGDVGSRVTSAADISYRFDLRHDDDNLYLAVDVTDDQLVSNPAQIARKQDNILVQIDVRDSTARAQSMDVGAAVMGGTMAQLAMLMLTPEPASPDRLLSFMDESAAASQQSVMRTERGYRAELALPHSFLNSKTGGDDWQDARISVSVYDFDDGADDAVVLHWQPYRFGDAPLAGTHAFRRGK